MNTVRALPPPAVSLPLPRDATAVAACRDTAPPSPSAAGAPADAMPPSAQATRDWRDEVLYFAMVDRFENGDPTNDQGVDRTKPEKFHGGDWQGVVNRLDDLKDQGVTTVWLSCPQLNDHDFLGMAGYHGYWIQDFYRPEPHLGDMAKLRELVDKAHARGMKVILDLVVNHVGYNHPFTTDPTKDDWFHHEGNIRPFSRRGLENGSLHGLPDLAQEDPKVSRYLMDMAKYWVDQTGIDGYRVDAVLHVPKSWLRAFADEMHRCYGKDFLLVGEAYAEAPGDVASYQSDAHFDSLFDFPVSNAIRSAIGFDESRGVRGVLADAWRYFKPFPHEFIRTVTQRHGDMRTLSKALAKDDAYPDPARLATMIDNHDMPRFPQLGGEAARDKTKLALSLLFTLRGIPTLYYGTEDGMGLHGEPNRGDKPWGAEADVAAHIRELARLRADSPALRRGAQIELEADRDTYAFARVHENDRMLVALNRAGHDLRRDVPVQGADLADGTVVEDVRTHERFTIDHGHLRLHLPARQARILRPTTQATAGVEMALPAAERAVV